MGRFVLDEDVQLSLAPLLRSAGHEAWHIQDVGLKGASDAAIIDYATRQEAALITADLGIADIRLLSVETHHGVVLLRMPEAMSTDGINDEIMRLLPRVQLADLRDTLVVIEPGQIRVRKAQQ